MTTGGATFRVTCGGETLTVVVWLFSTGGDVTLTFVSSLGCSPWSSAGY